MKNPFEGVTPDISVFGTQINGLAILVLAGVWGIVLIGVAIAALLGGAKWAAARQNHHSDEMTEAAGSLKKSLIAFAAVVAMPILFGAIIFLINRAG